MLRVSSNSVPLVGPVPRVLSWLIVPNPKFTKIISKFSCSIRSHPDHAGFQSFFPITQGFSFISY